MNGIITIVKISEEIILIFVIKIININLKMFSPILDINIVI